MPSSSPMSQCGTRWWGRRRPRRADDPQHDVVFGPAPSGASSGGRFGDAQEQSGVAPPRCPRRRLELALAVAQRAALGLQRLGVGDVTRLAQRAHLT